MLAESCVRVMGLVEIGRSAVEENKVIPLECIHPHAVPPLRTVSPHNIDLRRHTPHKPHILFLRPSATFPGCFRPLGKTLDLSSLGQEAKSSLFATTPKNLMSHQTDFKGDKFFTCLPFLIRSPASHMRIVISLSYTSSYQGPTLIKS